MLLACIWTTGGNHSTQMKPTESNMLENVFHVGKCFND